jgi:hypothetical protein
MERKAQSILLGVKRGTANTSPKFQKMYEFWNTWGRLPFSIYDGRRAPQTSTIGEVSSSNGEKEKKGSVRRPSLLRLRLSRRRPTFPHSYPCSIIGPARLNYRVRDGNGCDPRGMTTGNLRKLAALAISVISDQISAREENFEIVSRDFAECCEELV